MSQGYIFHIFICGFLGGKTCINFTLTKSQNCRFLVAFSTGYEGISIGVFSLFFLFISYESTYPAAGHMQITEQERIWNLIILQFSSHRRVLVILSALKPSVFAITLLECAVRSFRKKRRCPCYMILDSSILKYEDITIGLYIYFCRF